MTVDRTALGVWFQCLPEGWSAKRLKHLGKLKGGSGFPVQLQGDTDSELAFYKVGDLAKSKDGVYLSDPAHTITNPQARSLGARVFEEGTLVWAKIGAALLLNRRRIVSRPCCIDNNMTGFVPHSTVADPKFCYYLTSAIDFSPHVKPGAVPSYSEGDQAELSVPLPPLGLQGEIAATLDRETARIDALIEKKTRFIELLKEKRQALITQAVTKGLDPTVPMKDSGVEWIGEVPAHWVSMKFRHVARVTEGLVDPKVEPYRSMPLIAPNHIESNTGRLLGLETAEEQNAESGKYTCNAGDVIYSKIRPALAKVAIAPAKCLCSADMYPLQAAARTNPTWLYYLLLSGPFTAWATLESARVAMPKINRESLGELRVFLPPLDEQRSAADMIKRALPKMDAVIAKTESSIALLKERRSALITAAVTGQIDLREDAA